MKTTSNLVLNNMIAERLRSGDAEAVRSLRAFGVRPHMLIDDVVINQGSRVRRHSAWYWSHQASIADGVEVMWEMLDYQLKDMDPSSRLSLLAENLQDACKASLTSRNIAPLEVTWNRASRWIMESGANRSLLMSCLTNAVCELGDEAVPGLQVLADTGCITRQDWSFSSRKAYARDPLSSAVESDQQDLTLLLLDLGCDDKMQDGTSILAVAWQRLRVEVEKNALHVDGVPSAFGLVEALLARDMRWDVRVFKNDPKTVAEDAQDLIPVLTARQNWRRLANQVERRLMEDHTPCGPLRQVRPGRL